MTGLVLAAAVTGGTLPAATPALTPYPNQIELNEGVFRVGTKVRIEIADNNEEDRFAASLLGKELKVTSGVSAEFARGDGKPPRIVLARLDSALGKQIVQRLGLRLPVQAGEEGYGLVVTPHEVFVVAKTAAGVYYGVQTLRQLFHPVRGGGSEAPVVKIVDWPALRWRGVSIDVSRGPIPTLASLKREIELLAEFKINLFSLYFENSFDYPSLPLVAIPGGAITPAEATELVAFAQRHHVVILPQQEALGHMHLALQNETYQNMAEVPYGHVLSPTVPASFDFVRSMFGDLAQVFPSPFLHIGADETLELGQGRTKADVDKEGYGKVYIDCLKQIHETLSPLHRRLIFWGDMGVQHPEHLKELPKDMIAIPWGYDPEPSYASQIQPFRDAGLETWVAPGVTNWNRVFPDNALALPNIRQYAEDGKAMGSTGLLNTLWMDDGEGMVNFTWYGLVYGAANGWQKHVDDQQFSDAWDWTIHRAADHRFAADIAKLTEIHQLLNKSIESDGEDWLLWLDAFGTEGRRTYGQMQPEARRIRLLAEEVITDLAVHSQLAKKNQDLLGYVDFAARRFDLLGQKALYSTYIPELYTKAQANLGNPDIANDILYRINSRNNGLIVDLRNQTTWLRERYRQLWLGENKPHHLENILLRYTEEMSRIQKLSDHLAELHRAYNRTRQLPALFESQESSTSLGMKEPAPPAR